MPISNSFFINKNSKMLINSNNSNNSNGPWGGPWGNNESSNSNNNKNNTQKSNKPSNKNPNNKNDQDDFLTKFLDNIIKFIKNFFTLSSQQTPKPAIGLIILSLVLLYLSFGFYKVDPDENAVTLYFGKFYKISEPGLNYHIPFPEEEFTKAISLETKWQEIVFLAKKKITATLVTLGTSVGPTNPILSRGPKSISTRCVSMREIDPSNECKTSSPTVPYHRLSLASDQA
jgi:hypothetical protein